MIERMSELGQNARIGFGIAVATGALALTACGGPGEAPLPDVTHAEQATTAPTTAAPTTEVSTTTPAIVPPTNTELLANPSLLEQAYPTLPAQVQEAAKAAVEVHADSTLTIDHYKQGVFQYSEAKFAFKDKDHQLYDGGDGSGTLVETSDGHQVILTAGHVAETDDDHCAETTISFQSTTPDQQKSEKASRQAFVSGGDELKDTAHAPDMGVVITTPHDTNRTTTPLLPKPTINPGEAMFALTYQPEADGTERNPANNDDTKYPAEYGAIVLGYDEQTGLVAMLERGKSYGKTPDSYEREGASGGEVVTVDGRLWGTVEGGFEDPEGTNPQAYVEFDLAMLAIQEGNNPAIRDIAYRPGDQIMYVQPVAQRDVDTFYKKAQAAAPCVPRPHKRVDDK